MTPRKAKWGRGNVSAEPKTIDLRLAGLAPDGRLRVSSQVLGKDDYEARVAAIKEAWGKGGVWAEAVRSLKAHRVDLDAFYAAREQGVAGIEQLLGRSSSEPLVDLIRDYVRAAKASDTRKMRQRLARFAKWLGKGATVADVTTEQVEAFLDALIDLRTAKTTKTAAKGSTANRYRSVIGGMCTWAVAKKRMTAHPVNKKQVAKRDEPHHRLPEMSADEYRDYVQAARAARPDLVVVLLLLLHTGPDIGEVFLSETRDVDLERQRIRYERTKTARFGPLPRYVPLPDVVVEELRAHIAEHHLRGSTLLFGMVRRADVELAHRVAARAIARPELTIKDLRHIAAISWAKGGVYIRVVQKWLGHRNLSQTMKYADHEPEASAAAEMAARAAGTLTATMDVTPIRAVR